MFGAKPPSARSPRGGIFHPNERGRSRVEFTAAVDPAKYSILSVTAEPGDGNPVATGPEVLRLDSCDAGDRPFSRRRV